MTVTSAIPKIMKETSEEHPKENLQVRFDPILIHEGQLKTF